MNGRAASCPPQCRSRTAHHRSFRYHKKDTEASWRKAHRHDLLGIGMPAFVIDDRRRWNYVTLRGYDLESGWSPAWITREQAASTLGRYSPLMDIQPGIVQGT